MLLQIIVSVAGIFATAAITQAVVTSWRRSGWLFEQRMTYAKEDYIRKISNIASSFSAIDERISSSRSYLQSIMQDSDEDILNEREKYRRSVQEWNGKIHSRIIEMKSLFSPAIAYDFDRYFPYNFSLVDAHLRSARLSKGEIRKHHAKQAGNIIKHINAEARDFSTRLHYISEERRQYIDKNPEIKIDNIDFLSSSYLLKSLFVRRPYL